MADYGITFGNILTIVVMIGTGLGAFYGLRAIVSVLAVRVDAIDKAIDALRASIDKFNTVLVAQAVNNERMDNMQRQLDRTQSMVDELRHGEGMVLPLRGAKEFPR